MSVEGDVFRRRALPCQGLKKRICGSGEEWEQQVAGEREKCDHAELINGSNFTHQSTIEPTAPRLKKQFGLSLDMFDSVPSACFRWVSETDG